MNNIMDEVCERLGIEHVPVPTQVHSANGLAERFNRTLQLSLCKATGTVSTILEWDSLIEAAVVFSYNTAYQEALQDSPFFILHGRDAVLPTETWTFNPEVRVRVRREQQGSKGEAKTELVRRFERAWSRAVAATRKVVERRLKASTRKDVQLTVVRKYGSTYRKSFVMGYIRKVIVQVAWSVSGYRGGFARYPV